MVDFILVPGESDKVYDFVADRVPEFLRSEEHKGIGEEGKDLPVVFVSTFTDFLLRNLELAMKGPCSSEVDDLLCRCFKALERLATSRDSEVSVLLEISVFELIDWDKEILREMRKRLGPRSQSLLREWAKSMAPHLPGFYDMYTQLENGQAAK